MTSFNYKITQKDFMQLMGDTYAETIDIEILESKDPKDLAWFSRCEAIVEHILFNEFGVEVIDGKAL